MPLLRRSSSVIAGLILFGALQAADPVTLPTTPFKAGVDLKLGLGAGWRDGANLGTATHGLAIAHLDWAPAAADGAPSWQGHLSVLGLAGQGPSGKYLSDVFGADNTEGPESVRLYSWWLERNDGPCNLRFGALLADDEFAATECGGHFLNSAFGWPAFISANTVNTGPAFYIAGLGARLRWSPSETNSWMLGIFDGDTFDSPTGDPGVNPHGLHFRTGGSQGWFIIGETSWQASPQAVDVWKAGVWLHTADFSDVYRDSSGHPVATSGNPAALHRGNYGVYSSVEHTFQGKNGETGSMNGHVRVGFSPGDRSALNWVADAGLHWHGLLPSRPQDVLAFGYVYGHFSSDFAANARLTSPGVPAPDFEQVVEANYEYVLREKVSLQPDIQWIMHTGGSQALKDSLLLSLRFNASL